MDSLLPGMKLGWGRGPLNGLGDVLQFTSRALFPGKCVANMCEGRVEGVNRPALACGVGQWEQASQLWRETCLNRVVGIGIPTLVKVCGYRIVGIGILTLAKMCVKIT